MAGLVDMATNLARGWIWIQLEVPRETRLYKLFDAKEERMYLCIRNLLGKSAGLLIYTRYIRHYSPADEMRMRTGPNPAPV